MAVNLPKVGTIIAVKFWCISIKIGKFTNVQNFEKNLRK
jgi:hypothetical protein